MGKQLVIAEKPSVARDIAAALGGFEDKEEYLESDDYVVAWAVGHLLSLAEPQEYDKAFRSWSLDNLPIIPEQFKLAPRDGQKARLALIKKLGKRDDVDGLINACDAGREGEMIFRRIVEYSGLDKPVQRLWLQSMTKAALRKGFEELRPGEQLDGLGDAAWCRSVGDWLIGLNATRALTQRLKSRGEKGSWSAGRVQTPTLHMLVAREREILAHESEPYWLVFGTFSHGDQEWEARYYDPSANVTGDRDRASDRIFDRAVVDALMAGMADAKVGVASESRKPSTTNAPLPFDLTSLQREANRRFSFSARRTLDAAQRLYEGHKLITYPRTDSRHLPDDYTETINEVLGVLTSDHEYGSLAAGVLDEGPQNLDRILDGTKVSDHFAIIPTATEAASLGSDDQKIYDLVVRQFLASMMGPAIHSNVERLVEVTLADSKPVFRITARSLEIPGHLAALGKEAGQGTHLPPLVPGQDKVEGVPVASGAVREEAKETTPPPRFSEANLLRMMETAGENLEDDDLAEAMKDSGLGTPATRAETIEGLVSKQYARRIDRRLAPTSKAMRLMDVIDRVDVPTLASPRLTGRFEHDLRSVQNGELGRDEMYNRLTTFTRDVIANLKGFEHDALYASEAPLGPCPNCAEGQVVESIWGYPCSRNTKDSDDCHFIIWKDRYGRYLDRTLVTKLLRDRRVDSVPGFVDRAGRSLEANLALAVDPDKGRWQVDVVFGNSVDGEEEQEVGVLCQNPDDPEDEIVETNFRYVSRKILEGTTRKGPSLPKVVCHREMAPEEALLFFGEAGRTDTYDGFISKRGRPFRGLLFRKPTGKHGFEFPPREPKAGGDKNGPAKKGATTKAKKAPATSKAAPAKKAPAKKAPAKKAPAKKADAKVSAKKADAKTPAKKAATKKAPTKKASAKKASAKKASAKKDDQPAP